MNRWLITQIPFFVAAEDDLKPPATPQEKMYKNEDKLPVIPTK